MFYDFSNCKCCKKYFCYVCNIPILQPKKYHITISGHRKPTCKKHINQINALFVR